VKITRLFIGAAIVSAAEIFTAGAQTTSPPPATTSPGASPSSTISAATHCRDASGKVQLKSARTGSGSTTGAASNTAPSSSPGTSSSTNSPSGMPGSTPAEANLPPC